MMKIYLLICAMCVMMTIAHAQSVQYKFKEPVKLSVGINTEAEETFPVISKNGDKLYFVRALSDDNVGGKKGGQDIWLSSKSATGFGASTNKVGGLNNKGNNAVIGLGSDGQKIYLLNVYKSGDKMKPGVSQAGLNGGAYGEPVEIKLPYMEIKGDFYGYWMNPEGDTLLISMEGDDSRGQEDLYVCLKKDGKWQKPINLGGQINSFGYEISPYLSDDGKTLFFASNGKGGYGEADIYVSVREDDSWTKWSYPKNLGKPINSRGFDAYFIEHKNKVYFASNRDGGLSDIYVADYFKILPGQKFEEDLPKIKTVYFEFNGYMLQNKQKAVLDEVVTLMDDDSDLKITVSGYTCDIGDNETNEKLSGLRAEAVMTYLVIMGIDEDRITVKHYGESEAHELNRTHKDKALDRRVDVKFSY